MSRDPQTPAPDAFAPTEMPRSELPPTKPAESVSGAEPHVCASLVDPERYQITGEVARGGLGKILLAHDRRLDRPVALKELINPTGDIEERFLREAFLTAKLEHPAIVPIHDVGRWPSGGLFYAMKFVGGRSFDQLIRSKKQLNERLALLPHVIAVTEAMAYAHSKRIIHRDLKPANILVGSFGEAVVIDWGLAKDLTLKGDHEHKPEDPPHPSHGELTMTGAVMGTPSYMPPEQARGESVDERADVYSLGAILYHMLGGRPPYAGKSGLEVVSQVLSNKPLPLDELQPGVPSDLLALVKKAMEPDPRDRYPSAKELAEDLLRFQMGQLVSARRYSRWLIIGRFLWKHRLLSLLLLLVVSLFTYAAVLVRHDLQEHEAESINP